MPRSGLAGGDTFGSLTVVKRAERKSERNSWWLCRCTCGAETEIRSDKIRQGTRRACFTCQPLPKGGYNGSTYSSPLMRTKYPREYMTWCAMRKRCNDPTLHHYKYYGGRGISVCDRWLNSFDAFFEDMGERPEGLTLDRIDVNGNYEPTNCRWATWAVQVANRRPRKKRT